MSIVKLDEVVTGSMLLVGNDTLTELTHEEIVVRALKKVYPNFKFYEAQKSEGAVENVYAVGSNADMHFFVKFNQNGDLVIKSVCW